MRLSVLNLAASLLSLLGAARKLRNYVSYYGHEKTWMYIISKKEEEGLYLALIGSEQLCLYHELIAV